MMVDKVLEKMKRRLFITLKRLQVLDMLYLQTIWESVIRMEKVLRRMKGKLHIILKYLQVLDAL